MVDIVWTKYGIRRIISICLIFVFIASTIIPSYAINDHLRPQAVKQNKKRSQELQSALTGLKDGGLFYDFRLWYLARQLESSNSYTRRAAVTSLVKSGQQGIELLMNALDSRNSFVRRDIVETMAVNGDPSLVKPLI